VWGERGIGVLVLEELDAREGRIRD
jgi:hypothetical protein